MTFSPQQESDVQALKCELATEFLGALGSLRLRVSGGSMLPTIWGDVLSITRVSRNDVRKGDIVLFARHNRLIAHRVISEEGFHRKSHLLTRGDATLLPDAPVEEHELLGKVCAVARNGKNIELSRPIRFPAVLLAALLQRSRIAVRITLRGHKVLQAVTRENPNRRAILCRN